MAETGLILVWQILIYTLSSKGFSVAAHAQYRTSKNGSRLHASMDCNNRLTRVDITDPSIREGLSKQTSTGRYMSMCTTISGVLYGANISMAHFRSNSACRRHISNVVKSWSESYDVVVR